MKLRVGISAGKKDGQATNCSWIRTTARTKCYPARTQAASWASLQDSAKDSKGQTVASHQFRCGLRRVRDFLCGHSSAHFLKTHVFCHLHYRPGTCLPCSGALYASSLRAELSVITHLQHLIFFFLRKSFILCLNQKRFIIICSWFARHCAFCRLK